MKRRRTTARRKLQVINHAKSPAGRCRTPLQGLITTPSVARDFSHEKLVIAVISDGRKRKENETSDESSEQPLHFVLAPTFPFKIEGHPNETDKTRICHFPAAYAHTDDTKKMEEMFGLARPIGQICLHFVYGYTSEVGRHLLGG